MNDHDQEIVEGEVRDLTIIDQPREMLNATRTPEGTVELATRLATALSDIVERQHLFASISGKKFPTVEAWMTIARMDNVVAQEVVGGIVRHPDDSYEAMVELIRLSDGMVVGRGSALCGTPGDSPWDKRSLPVRRSMAVTRATSRAFRQQYSWIMALAGYEPTPAEEMREDAEPTRPASRPRPNAPQGAPPATQVTSASTPPPTEAPGASETGNDVLDAGIIQAIVSDAPEAHVRIVKDGHTEKRWEGERAKLELITKVGNRKHTGILLGPLAEAAAVANITVGEVVRFVGAVVEEIKWAEDKPTKKEIIGAPPTYMIADLLVMRDGEWWSVNQAMPTLLPAADVATPTPPSTDPTPSTPPPASTTAPSDPPGRMKGTTGEWTTLNGKLVDPVQFTIKGSTPVAILRVADSATGEIIMAALGSDIEQQVGSASKPFIKPGDMVGLYGEWKGDWLVVEMVGLAVTA